MSAILHNTDFYRLMKTGHPKGQKHKVPYHPTYTAFWNDNINHHVGVGLVLYRK